MDESKWIDFYQKASKHKVWVKVMTKDGKHFFFDQAKEWLKVKDHCEEKCTFIEDMELQFRSHKCPLDITGDEAGAYLCHSAMGEMGGDTTHFLTFGVLKSDGLVHKQMWMVPELLKDQEYADAIEDCFEEAIIYNEKKKKNNQEQVQT